MISIRVRHSMQGSHVEARVFAGKDDSTHALTGTLMFSPSEFDAFRLGLLNGAVNYESGFRNYMVEFVESRGLE